MFRVDKETATIYAYDIIGPSYFGYVSDGMIINALDELKDREVHLRINSPGGSVDMGVAIHGAIKRHGNVIAHVDALAASIASVFPMSAKKIMISKGAKFMIHDPWTIEIGNAKQLRKTASVLDTYAESILDIYEGRIKATRPKIQKMMEEETWFSSKESIEMGLALEEDPNDPPQEAKKEVPKNLFKNPPSDFKQIQWEGRSVDYNQLLVAVARSRIS